MAASRPALNSDMSHEDTTLTAPSGSVYLATALTAAVPSGPAADTNRVNSVTLLARASSVSVASQVAMTASRPIFGDSPTMSQVMSSAKCGYASENRCAENASATLRVWWVEGR
jgi:hypothetical protein